MSLLKNPIFLIGVAALLLVALILVLGEVLGWSWTVRLLGVIVVLFVCVVLLAISFARAAKGADAIEQSIKMQAQQQKSARPDRQRDVEDLERQLERAIQMLKQSKLGQGRRGRAALYALPWYLFIGPPGSGKTTAIANSGLNFPIGTDRVRGVGGTRNCDWFFSDRAILLDTAGRYVTEPEDEAEWLSFLETLKKHRPDRPVNGVIVGIGLPDISESTPEEVEWHADMIRSRIEELIRHLGMRFPIYLTFTKCDLLQGFVEFFGELGRREREQVWGCTLSQEQLDGDAAAVFEEEFEHLYSALLNRRVVRLSHAMKREERQKVFAFPLQFASLKDKLSLFVHRLFQPNPYQETPVFRGFYFTSGTQEGVPIDRVIQAIAAQFDLPPMRAAGSEPELETKSYFIRELFTDVIIPDQHLARRTSGAARRGRFMLARTAVAAVVLLALFVFAASQALVRSKVSLNRTHDAATAAALVRWDDPVSGANGLDELDRLREQAHRHASGSVLSLGLRRSGTVVPAANRLYVRQSQAFVERFPLRTIRQRLEAAAGARPDSGASQRLYDDLKAYLLLTQEVDRMRSGEAADEFRTFLARHLSEVGFESLQGARSAAGDVQDRVDRVARSYVDAVGSGRLAALPADEGLVARARRSMDQPMNLAGIYAQLRTRGRDRLQMLSLDDVDMPPRYRGVFVGRAEIERLYTKEGWESFAQDEIRRLSQDPTREDWVLGRGARQIPEELRDPARVSTRLQELYFTEYAGAWERMLRTVSVRPARSVADAAETLRMLGNTDSPLLYLLALVAAQTRFEGDGLLAAAGESVQQRVGSGSGPTHPVDRRFAWLHRLNPGQAVSGGAEAAPELSEAINAFKALADELEAVSGDADALAFASTVLQQNGGSMETHWRAVQRSVRGFSDRAAARNLLEAPVTAAWGAVLGEAQRALNVQWQEVVLQPYQRQIAGRYPFADSDEDALVHEVDQFFNPQNGTLTRFTGEQLRPFLSADLRQAASWNGQGMALSGVLGALEQARQIQAGLFSQAGVMRVAFEMRPGLPERSAGAPAVSQLYADLHGQRDTYNMGAAPWRAFEWPGGPPSASLTVSTQAGQLPARSHSGDWALFRLLQDARRDQRTASLYEVRWTFEQPGQYSVTALYELKAQRATNPFHDPRAFFRFNPPSAIR